MRFVDRVAGPGPGHPGLARIGGERVIVVAMDRYADGAVRRARRARDPVLT